jgi:GTPase involved in cell partitioning and DNA repair
MSMFYFSSKGAVLNDLLISIYLQELRMYNPKYLERPYVVVLNKIDLPKVQFHA